MKMVLNLHGSSDADRDVLKNIESKIGLHQDFPKKGVLYRDCEPLLDDVEVFQQLIDQLCKRVKDLQIDRVFGIESRGFILGSHVAERLKVPFRLIRKRNKIPGEVYSIEYDLEYGTDVLEISKKALPKFSRCLIFDDLLATGGTMTAAKKLIEMCGSQVVAGLVIIDLADLHKPDILADTKLISLFRY